MFKSFTVNAVMQLQPFAPYYSKTKLGYEIPLTRHFYVYQPPRALEEMAGEITQLEKENMAMLSEVV